MINSVKTMRWRLLMGVVSLATAVSVTLPAAASRVDLAQRVGHVWSTGLSVAADIIWPNSEFMDVIWPNAAVLGGGLTDSGSGSDQGNQDSQASQDSQT